MSFASFRLGRFDLCDYFDATVSNESPLFPARPVWAETGELGSLRGFGSGLALWVFGLLGFWARGLGLVFWAWELVHSLGFSAPNFRVWGDFSVCFGAGRSAFHGLGLGASGWVGRVWGRVLGI